MRLSTVFELLLIFLLIAFAAYGRVIDRDEVSLYRVVRSAKNTKQSNTGVATISLKQATENVNKYCNCNEDICNCCRDFNIPVVQIKGPGCASLQYLQGDKMAVQLSFGDNILTSTVVNGKSPKPVCVPLPGGFSKFCGRIYSIERDVDQHFKACLGLELQSSRKVEASLRVSCFRFGPDGLKLRPAEPLPVVDADPDSDEDDDDDDDLFGFGSDADDDSDDADDDDDDDDDEDDDEDDAPAASENAVPASSDDPEDSADDEDDDDDVLGLGALFDIFDDDETSTKKPKVTTSLPDLPFTIPLLSKPTAATPVTLAETVEPAQETGVQTSENDVPVENSVPVVHDVPVSSTVSEPVKNDVATEAATEATSGDKTSLPNAEDGTVAEADNPVPLGSVIQNNVVQSAASDNVEYVVKPEEPLIPSTNTATKVVKLQDGKPSVTSQSVNAIKKDEKKPVAVTAKPGKPGPVKNDVKPSGDDDDDDDDDDILGAADLDEDDEDEDETEETTEEDETDKDEEADEDEDEDEDDDEEEEEDEKEGDDKDENDDKEDDNIGLLDDDDEEEDAEVLSALVGDDKDEAKLDKVSNNEAENHEEDDADYGFDLAQMLARRKNQRHVGRGRQSKVMRL